MIFFEFVFDAACVFFGSSYFWLWFPLLFMLLFVATVPRIIRALFMWR